MSFIKTVTSQGSPFTGSKLERGFMIWWRWR